MAKTPTAAKPRASRKTAAKPAPAKSASQRKSGAPRKASAAKRGMSSNTAWSIGAIVVAASAGLAAFLSRGRIAATVASATGTAEGHVPTDLLDPNRNADDRAIADFRPDMGAVMTAAEREAMRPATGPGPSIMSSNGTMNSQTGASN